MNGSPLELVAQLVQAQAALAARRLRRVIRLLDGGALPDLALRRALLVDAVQHARHRLVALRPPAVVKGRVMSMACSESLAPTRGRKTE